jgi:hypothetical protein
MFEVGRMDRGQFFLSLSILHRATKKKIEVIGIYGPADHARSRGFLAEITDKALKSAEETLRQRIGEAEQQRFADDYLRSLPAAAGTMRGRL